VVPGQTPIVSKNVARACCVGARPAAAFAVCAALLAAGSSARAAEPNFRAQVDRSQVPLDETFRYQVTLSVEDGKARDYTPPDLKAFEILSSLPSQSHQYSMGSRGTFAQTVYTWTYELAPRTKGRFTIGPAQISVGGEVFKSRPVAVEIIDALGSAGAASQRPPAARGRRSLFPPGLFGGRLGRSAPVQPRAAPKSDSFARVTVAPETVYVGQAVLGQWDIFLTGQPDNFNVIKEPGTDGFWSETIDIKANARGLSLERVEHDGRPFLKGVVHRKALFPLRAGALTLTPFEVEVSQVDFFGNTIQAERLATESRTIKVLELPQQGRPPGFDPAAVGAFELQAAAETDRVEVGQAVTVALTISGRGNVRKLQVPKLPDLPGWRVYEPKVSHKVDARDEGVWGQMTVEFLLLPERPGQTTLPPFEMAFFEPESAQYKIARSEPVHLMVSGSQAAAVNSVSQSAKPDPRRETAEAAGPSQIRSIRTTSSWRERPGLGWGTPVFWAALVLPPLGLLMQWGYGWSRRRRSSGSPKSRARKVHRELRRRFEEVAEKAQGNDRQAFFSGIHHLLHDMLSQRLSLRTANLSREALAQALKEAAVTTDHAEKALAFLELCEQARFAPGTTAEHNLQEILSQVEELVEQIPRGRS